MTNERLAHILLRVGVAFSFLYPPVAAIGDPISWFSYFPRFIQDLPLDQAVILHGFGAIEAVIAVWLLTGWKIRIPAALATVMLIAIVAFNPSQMDVVFRDLSIAAMTLALALWPKIAEVLP